MEKFPPELTELLKHIRQRFPDVEIPDYALDLTVPFDLFSTSTGKAVVRIIPPSDTDNPFWRWKDISHLPTY
jgi:hypothetical protein